MTSAERRIAFRVPVSHDVGLGHVRRCSALAMALATRDVDLLFVVAGNEDSRALVEAVTPAPLRIVAADLDSTIAALTAWAPSLTVLDDYALTGEDVTQLRRLVGRVAVIDDLAGRRLDVDLVLNASVGAEALHYDVLPTTQLLLGERYALLRPEFIASPVRPAITAVRRVLVTFGGSDPTKLSAPTTAAVLSLPSIERVDVVLGPLATEVSFSDARVVVHRAPLSMAALMAEADLAVSAGGQTLLELAAMNVATIAIAVAENQRLQLGVLRDRGAVVAATMTTLRDVLHGLAAAPERLRELQKTAHALVDGLGAERVADELLALATSPG